MEENTENTGELREYQEKPGGKFKEGNPGKPIGAKNYLTQLEEAIKKYETETGKKLFDRLIQRAYVNDQVLLNVIKKFIPDKTASEITTPEGLEIIVKRAGTDDNKDS